MGCLEYPRKDDEDVQCVLGGPPLQKRRGGGGDSSGGGPSEYLGGASSAPSGSSGGSVGSSSEPRPDAVAAPKAAVPAGKPPAAPKEVTPKPAATPGPLKPVSEPAAPPGAPKAKPAPAPAPKPASKPAEFKPAIQAPEPDIPKQVSTAPQELAVPPAAPAPMPNTGPYSGADLASWIYGKPFEPERPNRPEVTNPQGDHGHVSSVGKGVGEKDVKTQGHSSSCGTGCKNALAGTFGGLAIVGGLALLLWWLAVRRRRKSRSKNRSQGEEDGAKSNIHENTEKRSESPKNGGTPPVVALKETSDSALPGQILTAVEPTGRASPAVMDGPPRSPRSESDGELESDSSTIRAFKRLSRVPEEPCVQPEETQHPALAALSASSKSRRSSDVRS